MITLAAPRRSPSSNRALTPQTSNEAFPGRAASPPAPRTGPSAAIRAAFLAIFFASGFTALLYQTVWQRMLTLFGGADIYSVTIIVAAFMAGLGFGHLAGGHLADHLGPRARLVTFAACELAVGLFAVLSTFIYYDTLYVRFGAVDLPYAVLAGLIFLVTLWPTFLMGMSLPLAARALTDDAVEAGRWVPLLYGWNTIGAACGAFAVVAVLFRMTDFTRVLWVGAAISLGCGLGILLLAPALLGRSGTLIDRGGAPGDPEPLPATSSHGLLTWIAAYALSGFVALSLEIVWFRVLGVILKSNAFTFGHLLTLYLGGVGVGALVGNGRWIRSRHPGSLFFLTQAAIPLYAALALAALVASVDRIDWARPLWDYMAAYEPFGRPSLGLSGGSSTAGATTLTAFFAAYVLVPALLIGPPTVMMGVSFSLLQRAVQTDLRRIGRRVGWLQTANVVGATTGAMLTGLLLLDRLGSVGTMRVLTCSSLLFLGLYARSAPALSRWRLAAAATLALVTPALLPPAATFWARLHGATPTTVLQHEDGSGLSLLKGVGTRRVTVFANGLGQSALPYGGIHTALGALPVLLHPQPRSVAVIGLGAGDTVFAAGGRAETTTIDTIEIIEAQRETLHALTRSMPDPALHMLFADPRIRFHFTDGRAFIRKGGRRYDVIEADALRPSSAFAGNLYSVEYFEMLRAHLEPGGFAVSWAPTVRVHDSMVQAFPYVAGFADIAIGSTRPIDINLDHLRARLRDGFTMRYYADGGLDIARALAPVLAVAPVLVGPETARGRVLDLNHDLFPKDEFGVPFAIPEGGRK